MLFFFLLSLASTWSLFAASAIFFFSRQGLDTGWTFPIWHSHWLSEMCVYNIGAWRDYCWRILDAGTCFGCNC